MAGKIIGSLMVIISFSGLGFWSSKRRLLCRKQMLELKRLLLLLRDEIRFAHTPLPGALIRIGGKSIPPFKDIFREMGENLMNHEMDGFYNAWEMGINRLYTESCLKWEDLEELLALGKNLGTMDFMAQLNRLDAYLQELEGRLCFIQEENKEKVKLYRILGIISGIFLTILLV